MAAVRHPSKSPAQTLILPRANHVADMEIIQKHFYEGYNRLIIRAMDLERRELGPVPDAPVTPSGSSFLPRPLLTGLLDQSPLDVRCRSVSFQHPLSVPRPSTASAVPHAGSDAWGAKSLMRRNTVEGLNQEGTSLRFIACL